jgi:hypothetical protein
VLLSEADGKKLLFQELKSGKDLIQTPFGNLPTISEKVGWTATPSGGVDCDSKTVGLVCVRACVARGGGDCGWQGLDLMQTPFGNLPTSSAKVGLMQGSGFMLGGGAGRGLNISLDCTYMLLAVVRLHSDALWQPTHHQRKGGVETHGKGLPGWPQPSFISLGT